jgi:response regulator RpfG family c-di-GMP phosphodiesterase
MSRSTVLVVEDERKIRNLRGYLAREGLRVLTTESGAEAIALAHSSRPDLLVPAPTPAVSRWAVAYGVRRPRCDTTREQGVFEGAIA